MGVKANIKKNPYARAPEPMSKHYFTDIIVNIQSIIRTEVITKETNYFSVRYEYKNKHFTENLHWTVLSLNGSPDG